MINYHILFHVSGREIIKKEPVICNVLKKYFRKFCLHFYFMFPYFLAC